MKFLGFCLLFLPHVFGFLSSPGYVYKRTRPVFLSISVMNVSKDNLQLLESPKKYAFIKLENISNKDIEEVFFRSISLLEENGGLLFDLQKYQHHFIQEMICYDHSYDFGDVDFNQNTFFWNKKLKERKICM